MKRTVLIILSLLTVIFSVSIASQSVIAANKCEEDIVIYNYKNSENMIALTFDDGPHPRQTRQILDILDEYGIKATFFVVGINIDNYGEALDEIVARGHEIGNHTYTHKTVNNLDYDSLKKEIQICEAKILEKTHIKTNLMRPPEGMIDTSVMEIARELDYKVILWDLDTRDWAHTSAQDISNHITSKIRSGDIILMHDYIGKNSPTAKALRLFIPKLLDMGYKFVVVSELIDAGN